ncbi:GtrA family protein [Candidatus Woesearchaeota archaeon]|nr:GtrA family protein [Candidatus Woesearchaeota archaeon]
MLSRKILNLPVFHSQFVKFAVVGGLSTIVNYVVFALLLRLFSVQYLISSAIGYIAGVLVGFILNKFKTFKSKEHYKGELIKYFIVYAFSLFLGLSLLKTFVHNYKMDPLIAVIIVIGFTTFTNFFGCKFFAFRKTNVPGILKSKLFLSVLVIKILFSFFFGSDLMVKGFAPFINYFISSGFSNPYDFFLAQNLLKAFPYPTIMLAAMSFPSYLFYFMLDLNWQTIGMINLFLMRVPLLLADIGVFYILTLMLKGREKSILIFYWCSPIVFYINYFHGQLDAIPVFFLILSIYLLLIKKESLSFLFLGLALASKSNIFAAVPFIFLYLWRNRYGIISIIRYFGISFLTYILLIWSFLFSEGYKQLVLMAEEQSWLFVLNIPYLKDGIVLYIAPLVVAVLFFRMAYFKSINKDAFIMSLAMVFIVLVTFVPPRPGWFLWSIPFLTYFFIKDEGVSRKYYFAISLLYVLFFVVLHQNSDILHSFQPISSSIASLENPHHLLLKLGFDAGLISDIVFTLFIGVLLTNAFFVYKNGIISNLEYKVSSLNLGIAGDSGSGKNWTTNLIKDFVGEKNLTLLEGDDLHKWERGNKNWKITTHLNPRGNFLNLGLEHLQKIKEDRMVFRRQYDHTTGKFTQHSRISPSKFILISGLHTFYLSKMRQLLDLKIFMDPDEGLRRHWKIIRDMKERSHKKERVVKQLEKRSSDSKKYVSPQKDFADISIRYEPKARIKNEWDESKKIKLVLKLTIDNAYSPHELMDLLSNIRTLKTNLEYNDNMSTYSCAFDGTISRKEIERTAYLLVPSLDDVLENNNPRWRDNYDGIAQLFILYLITENLKNKKFTSYA